MIFSAGKKAASGKNGKKQNTQVRIETIGPGEFIEVVNAPGEIRPKTKVDISAKVAARIIELPFEEGDSVTAGEKEVNPSKNASLLLRLDSKDLESQMRSAEANRDAQIARIEVEKSQILSQKATLEGTLATLNQKKLEFERQKKLLQTQDVSQSSFDQTQCNLQELESRYNSSMHTIKAAEQNLVVMQHNLKAA